MFVISCKEQLFSMGMFVIRLATGDVVEMESEPDKKVEGGGTPPTKSMIPWQVLLVMSDGGGESDESEKF